MQQRDAVLSGRECSALFFPSERAQVRVPPHVRVQAGHRQVQVVGPADQSGEHHPQGRARSLPPAASRIPHPLLSLAARKTDFHKLSPPTVLLDRQVGGFDHGGHQADGGRDPKRAGGGTCLARRASIVLVIAALLQTSKPL